MKQLVITYSLLPMLLSGTTIWAYLWSGPILYSNLALSRSQSYSMAPI